MLGKLARQHDPNVLVGFDTADDAGVYLLDADHALVQTVDFFTPVVDDPFTYGQIAATNSLSDVYAMGGTPMSALAMVCFPDGGDLDVLERIMAGGLSKMMEAGCAVLGGHSVRDPEIKFGYAVTGSIHPKRVWKNTGARAGDTLIFTKALGTGVVSTAIKRGEAKQAWIDAAVTSMTTLNRHATEALLAGGFEVHGATDVTGFGMIGHAREMALGGKVTLRIRAEQIARLPGALDCIRAGFIPGGLKSNRDFAECVVQDSSQASAEVKTLLYDPQTAGGLLLSVGGDADGIVAALKTAGVEHATVIGEVVVNGTKPIELL